MAKAVDQAARAATARWRVSRAAGLLREARADLAAASDGVDTVAIVHASTDRPARDEVLNGLELAIARYGAVDVVILARPGGSPHSRRERQRRSSNGT